MYTVGVIYGLRAKYDACNNNLHSERLVDEDFFKLMSKIENGEIELVSDPRLKRNQKEIPDVSKEQKEKIFNALKEFRKAFSNGVGKSK